MSLVSALPGDVGRGGASVPCRGRCSHPLRRADPEQAERRARSSAWSRRRARAARPRAPALGADHLAVAIEGVEVGGGRRRVGAEPVRGAALGRRRDLAPGARAAGGPAPARRGSAAAPSAASARAAAAIASLARRTPSSAGLAQDARDPRVRVLDVVDGVVLRCERASSRSRSIAVSWLRWSMKKRAASTPMSSISSSRVTNSPLRFDIRARSPPSTMLTSCMIGASKRSGSPPSAASAAFIRGT